ncbi:hypothetical protein [Actinomycetospora termitidis]|uniref:Basic proline-rich protein n=1 Tax=Actinomycetospora termitidis TaxID=3053470 RepID=A0ABT7M1H5_9PSEU|nr:hypothetical protein [Actinomycetospora sp. Odt1-22]MDL5154507.1 hypothetical protein [Actinomycetospora sp. Odt1-22]
MAEAVPRPDGAHPDPPHPDRPRPEPRPADGHGRPARSRGGRDPVALAAWRRVAEQRRRVTDPADEVAPDEVVPPGPDVSAAAPEPVDARTPAVGIPAADARTPADGLPTPAGEPTPTAAAPAAGDRTPATGVPVADRPVEEAHDTEVAAGPDPDDLPSSDRALDDPVPEGPAPDDPVSREPVPTAPPGPAAPVLRDPAAGPPPGDRPGRSADPRRADAPVCPDDGPPAPGRLHDVLLGLAGRLDDDALTTVRELVAAEDDAEAAELLGGCLLADEVGLNADERAVLAPWFAATRVDPDLLAALPVDPDARRRSGHRFTTTAGDATPATPLARAARRLSGVLAVRESWRVTPAGAAPGPVPHRVVLVETADPDDCDHVVHHLAHAARGLGGTSVEVFASGVALPAYHRDALAVARPLAVSDPPARPDPPSGRVPVVEDDETWRTVADAGTAHEVGQALLERTVEPDPAPPAVEPPEPAAGAAPTSIDDDLSVTARRIAALWARPVPEDFSAPLPPDSLEETRLEPAGPVRDVVGEPSAPERDEPDGPRDDGLDDADGPVGRHGRVPEVDLGTTSFRAPRPGPAPYLNGHRLDAAPVDEADEAGDLVDVGDPTPPDGTPTDDAQVQRARHSRGSAPEEPTPPARFGHDARFGAGPGPAWPGAPVTGTQPGADTVFASPVEIGEEPITLGTNGHRHNAVAPAPPEEPATGPVTWSEPAAPVNGTHLGEPPVDPRGGGDVAPPWAASDGAGWSPEPGAWSPPRPGPGVNGATVHGAMTGGVAPGPPMQGPGHPPQPPAHPGPPRPTDRDTPDTAPSVRPPSRPADPEATGSWAPDTDDSVAQLSDRERELLARLHEELAQRERAEGADPFGGPPGRPGPRPGPPPPPGPPPGGRTNGHGLPGGQDGGH